MRVCSEITETYLIIFNHYARFFHHQNHIQLKSQSIIDFVELHSSTFVYVFERTSGGYGSSR